MISVEFKKVGPGTCSWCRKEKEVFTVAFGDRTFTDRRLCWLDLKNAILHKLAESDGEEEKSLEEPVGNDG
jgi:hypothetical protein